MSSTLEGIARLLGRIHAGGTFATPATRSPRDLHLEVEGVGRIPLPVAPATARKLTMMNPAGRRSSSAGRPWR